jgi:hypothetical protein
MEGRLNAYQNGGARIAREENIEEFRYGCELSSHGQR